MTWTITGPTQISEGDGSARLIAWTGGATADGAAAAVELPEWADNCVQAIGTISGATLTIEGSNDGTNWETLNNAQGGALSFTSLASTLKQIVERPRYIRPKLAGGTATGIGVYLLMRRANPLRT
jgi:hypothetical protein